MTAKKTTEQYLTEAKAIHGDTYIYGKTIYNGSKVKGVITCRVHGGFLQTPTHHLKGCGCPKCGDVSSGASKKTHTFESFVEKSEKVHGRGKYGYRKVIFVNSTTPVIIECQVHGDFNQTPKDHQNGAGCEKCSYIARGAKRSFGTLNFIAKSKGIPGGENLDYSKAVYVNNKTPVDLGCPHHGWYVQTPSSRYTGAQCPQCAIAATHDKQRSTTSEWIEKAEGVHGKGTYDYSRVKYVDIYTEVEIGCWTHGWFWQIAGNHIGVLKQGCPSCGEYGPSKGEVSLADFVESLVPIIRSDRTIIRPSEIDVYIPSAKLGVEYNGLYYHSTAVKKDRNFHLKKTRLATAAGVSLIHVFEDEWLEKRPIVESIIKSRLGFSGRKLGARATQVKTVPTGDARIFLNTNHLKGYVTDMPVKLGLYSWGELIMLATFSDKRPMHGKLKPGWWELVRLCTLNGTQVQGGFSKLLKAFISGHSPKGISTFCDLRLFDGRGYEAVGFKAVRDNKPSYTYVKQLQRLSRHEANTEKFISSLQTYDTKLSERVNMLNNKYYRIYDCGNRVYEMAL